MLIINELKNVVRVVGVVGDIGVPSGKMKKIITKSGFELFDGLPEGYRLAVIDDFHTNGRKNIGMEFLIRWADSDHYQPCTVSQNLRGDWLKPFINENRVFVKSVNEAIRR